jgi:hypothetical protein
MRRSALLLPVLAVVALLATTAHGGIAPSENARRQTVEADTTLNVAGTLEIAGVDVTATAAELNLLDGVTATFAEINILDGVTATASEINILDGVTSSTAEPNLLDGVTATTAELNLLAGAVAGAGAENGAAVAATETGNPAVHRTVLTLTALSITVTDATTAGAHGSHKLYDFPEGAIQVFGCSYDLTTLAGVGGIRDTAALVGALGSVTAATDNDGLTSTEADIIASTAGTLTAGAGVLQSHGSIVTTAFDGTTTALDLFLNVAIPDADSSANDTLEVAGTVICVWANLGDY